MSWLIPRRAFLYICDPESLGHLFLDSWDAGRILLLIAPGMQVKVDYSYFQDATVDSSPTRLPGIKLLLLL